MTDAQWAAIRPAIQKLQDEIDTLVEQMAEAILAGQFDVADQYFQNVQRRKGWIERLYSAASPQEAGHE